MSSYLKLLRRGYTHRKYYETWLELLLNFNSWHYIAPTHPKAVFLDTRTMRDYYTAPKPINFGQIMKEGEGCPKLINQTGWSLIYRKCTDDYTITHTKADTEITPYLWKDHLRYKFIEKGLIIEATNNLGLLPSQEIQSKTSL
jgi:hypothetical protein